MAPRDKTKHVPTRQISTRRNPVTSVTNDNLGQHIPPRPIRSTRRNPGTAVTNHIPPRCNPVSAPSRAPSHDLPAPTTTVAVARTEAHAENEVVVPPPAADVKKQAVAAANVKKQAVAAAAVKKKAVPPPIDHDAHVENEPPPIDHDAHTENENEPPPIDHDEIEHYVPPPIDDVSDNENASADNDDVVSEDDTPITTAAKAIVKKIPDDVIAAYFDDKANYVPPPIRMSPLKASGGIFESESESGEEVPPPIDHDAHAENEPPPIDHDAHAEIEVVEPPSIEDESSDEDEQVVQFLDRRLKKKMTDLFGPETEEEDDGSESEEEEDEAGRDSDVEVPRIPGTRALDSLMLAVDDDFFDDSSNDEREALATYTSPVRRGRPKISDQFSQRKPSVGAPHKEVAAYKKALKSFYDEMRKKKMLSPSKRAVTEYTGDHHPTLRTMKDVEKSRLSKAQTFRSRDILLLRTKEEANLRGISIVVEKSDVNRFICWSREEPNFVVIAYQSQGHGYTVKVALVRDMDTDSDWNGDIPGGKSKYFVAVTSFATSYSHILRSVNAKMLAANDKKVADQKLAAAEKEKKLADKKVGGDADTVKAKTVRGKITPFKAKDLVPLVRSAMAKNPSMSNKAMESILSPYGKTGKNSSVFTNSLLQNTRTETRKELFGDPETNATYATGLKIELEKHGHYVHVQLANRKETLKNIYTVTWDEWKARNPDYVETKQQFCSRWCEEHSDDLYFALGDVKDHLLFVNEFFFSPSTAKATVPKLQRVFQADAAHTAFGKYTLFSFYGTTANGTMSPVALGLVFGNETKASWMSFCKFIANLHPSINEADVTIITDRCKGSIAAIDEYFPSAFQFHCSYHRAANILLNCKGGKVKHSSYWLYKTLVNCGSKATLDRVRDKYSHHLTEKQLRYLHNEDVKDEAQYPAARCAMGPNIFLYDHEASSGVESMNQANKPARDRAAVDVVNATMLLLQMERYIINLRNVFILQQG
jgi:MULE transposase domain